MSQKSLEQSPNVYDLQAIKPIEEVLQSYFCHIHTAYEFQEATLEKKKEILREIALEIDSALNTSRINKSKLKVIRC